MGNSDLIPPKELLQQLEETQAALALCQAQFDTVFHEALDVIMVIDGVSGKILDVNQTVFQVLGYPREALIGQHYSTFMPPLSHSATPDEFLAQFKIHGVAVEGLEFRRIDGSVCPIDLTVKVIPWQNETAIMATLRDVTDRVYTETTQQKLIQELDAFAHTVAHDLKTPLGVVIGAGEILQDFETLTHGQLQEISTLINRNGSKMNDIIKELLLLAQVRSDHTVVLYPLKMAEIVVEAQQRLAHVIDELQAELILPDTWPVVYGYGPWIEEVWYNYLSNALKYGGRPPRIELGASPATNGYTRFWIKDNGSGITSEMQDKLFTRTLQSDRIPDNGGYRLDEHSIAGYRPNGHGLGLSIVRRIVERFKGEVEVESHLGKGSTFSFTLPNTA